MQNLKRRYGTSPVKAVALQQKKESLEQNHRNHVHNHGSLPESDLLVFNILFEPGRRQESDHNAAVS